jgi:hypothetical protein
MMAGNGTGVITVVVIGNLNLVQRMMAEVH